MRPYSNKRRKNNNFLMTQPKASHWHACVLIFLFNSIVFFFFLSSAFQVNLCVALVTALLHSINSTFPTTVPTENEWSKLVNLDEGEREKSLRKNERTEIPNEQTVAHSSMARTQKERMKRSKKCYRKEPSRKAEQTFHISYEIEDL